MSAQDVRLVLDFLNTVHIDDGTDELASEPTWQEWTRARLLGAGDRGHARVVRDALRACVGDPVADPGELAEPVRISLVAGIPTVTSPDAVGAVLAAATRLAVVGEWDRFKVCPADGCRRAFFDRSRNRSRTWCSMRLCGNREKARAWRERARAGIA